MTGALDRSVTIDPDKFELVVRGVLAGKYHLLLGAGASVGATNPAGDVPLATFRKAETGVSRSATSVVQTTCGAPWS